MTAARQRSSNLTYVALLRGINLAGHRKVAMSDLRDLMARLHLDNPRTLLQSGNLLFDHGSRNAAKLEQLLESETQKRLGLQTDYFVRSAAEWRAIVARNPFPKEASIDPGHLVVVCLKEAPGAGELKSLRAAITGSEVVEADGRHLYVVYPDGIGRSRLTHSLIEKKLGTRGTGRNWNTVVKLHALAC
jgi:uncharacterized protein (DUF1697 family)